MVNSYPAAPEADTSDVSHRRKLAKTINSVLKGKLNATTSVTLTQNAASTTLNDPRITTTSYIGLMPQTANAAAALATTYLDAASMSNGSAIIQHSNNAQTDRTFTILIIG